MDSFDIRKIKSYLDDAIHVCNCNLRLNKEYYGARKEAFEDVLEYIENTVENSDLRPYKVVFGNDYYPEQNLENIIVKATSIKEAYREALDYIMENSPYCYIESLIREVDE